MYQNIATQENIATLARRNMMIWGPGKGEQACGDVGMGRMLEPMQLVGLCEDFFAPKPLHGRSVVITAGPTREAIDPVRYISNHSSGKMGFALAATAAKLGANVSLISGPVSLATPNGVNRIDVTSAEEMYQASLKLAKQHDIFIGCAAVADYRPEHLATQKIKKSADNDNMHISMVKNPDIIAAVASLTEARPFTIGFAAETQDVENYAKDKLQRKGLDMICANDVSVEGQGFNSDNNSITVYWADDKKELGFGSKTELSQAILLTALGQID